MCCLDRRWGVSMIASVTVRIPDTRTVRAVYANARWFPVEYIWL